MNARRMGNFVLVNRAEVDYIDVRPSSWFQWLLRWCRFWSTTTPTAR